MPRVYVKMEREERSFEQIRLFTLERVERRVRTGGPGEHWEEFGERWEFVYGPIVGSVEEILGPDLFAAVMDKLRTAYERKLLADGYVPEDV